MDDDLQKALTAAHPIQTPIDEYDHDREWRRKGVIKDLRRDAVGSFACHVMIPPVIGIFWICVSAQEGDLVSGIRILAFFGSLFVLACAVFALALAGSAFARVCWKWSLLDWRERLWGGALWTIDCTLCAYVVATMLF